MLGLRKNKMKPRPKKYYRDVVKAVNNSIGDGSLPPVTELPRKKLPTETKMHVIYYLSNNAFRGLSVCGGHLKSAFTGEEMNAYGTVYAIRNGFGKIGYGLMFAIMI